MRVPEAIASSTGFLEAYLGWGGDRKSFSLTRYFDCFCTAFWKSRQKTLPLEFLKETSWGLSKMSHRFASCCIRLGAAMQS